MSSQFTIKQILTGIKVTLISMAAYSGLHAQDINADDLPEFKPGEAHPVEIYMQRILEMRQLDKAPKEISPDDKQQRSTDNVDLETFQSAVFAEDDDADPDSLIAYSYLQFWQATQQEYPGMALSVAAWQNTSSYANFGMADMGTVPREPLPTDRDYAYIDLLLQPWLTGYSAIKMTEEVLAAIDDGQTIEAPDGTNATDEAEAMAYFVQGITYGFIAQLYEGGFIYELGDKNFQDVNFVDYQTLREEAIDKLETAQAHADFGGEIPFKWMPVIESNIHGDGGDVTVDADRFEQIINSYKTRTKVLTARDEDERTAIDWDRVGELTEDGIQEHLVLESGEEGWHDQISAGVTQDPIWTRAAYPTIGRYDESGNFENWLNEDWADRTEFVLETPDRRIAGDDGSTDPGLYFEFVGPSSFGADSGTYFFSQYNHARWFDSYIGSVPDMHTMLTTEMDLYRAEAELRADDVDAAVDLINNTRVDYGELEPADTDATEEELMEKINYERRIELINTATGVGFFDMRSQDLLIEGTQEEFTLDPMIAPPVLTSPEINSIDNPGDLTLEVGYFEDEFAFHMIPEEISIQVATDPWIEDVVFEEANTTEHSFDLELDEGKVYYVHLTSHEDETGENYHSEEIYAFATVGHEPTEIATIYDEIVEEEKLRPLSMVEGVAITPYFDWNGSAVIVDDGTGGMLVRDFDEAHADDIEVGDLIEASGNLNTVTVAGDLPTFYIHMHEASIHLTGEQQDPPEYKGIDAEILEDDLHDSNYRRVKLDNVKILNPEIWDDLRGRAINMVEVDSDVEFNLDVSFAELAEDYPHPPLGVINLKGINNARGDLISFTRDQIEIFEQLSPADGESVETLNPELSWSAVDEIDNYNVVVYSDEAATDTIQHHEGITGTSIELEELDMGQTYYWQVHPIGEDSDGDEMIGMASPLRSFNTGSVELALPQDDAEDVEIPVQLVWDEIDQVESYEVDLSHTASFDTSLVVKGTEDSEIEIDQVVTDTTQFYWRVRAEVDGQMTNWSEIWSFTTELRPPEVPEWKSEDGAEDVEDLFVEWSSSERADTYKLQLAEDENFEELIVDEEGLENTEFEIDELEGNTTYYWRIEAQNPSGGSGWSDVLSFTTAETVSAEEDDSVPEEFALKENYPNPFNPETQISYAIPEQADVQLEVYNVLGEHVTTLVNEQQSPGRYEVNFDAANLSSGTYIYRIEAGDFVETKQMMFVK